MEAEAQVRVRTQRVPLRTFALLERLAGKPEAALMGADAVAEPPELVLVRLLLPALPPVDASLSRKLAGTER